MPIKYVLFIYEQVMKDNQLHRTGRRLISPQVFLAMKLTVCIFFLSIFGVMGSARAQRVSISAQGLPLQKVLTEISKQAKHILIYDEKDLKDSKVVTTRFTDKPMTEALDIVLEGQRVRYTIKGRSIVISRFSKEAKQSSQKIPSVSEQQDAIRGRVTDSAGNALAGVTVQVKGTNIRTLTNASGEYKFTNIDNNAVLLFSSIGYVPVELATSGHSTLNISLNATNSRIEEVEVNAGYWKVSDKLRTGNISKVSGDIIRQQPVLNPILALAGRVAGLHITQTSGLPGASSQIRIRGTNSIANGNDPLILIDGIPFSSQSLTNSVTGGGAASLSPFALINAEEIETIEVLKDADATAIYGSRGANGVILITTKKGKAGRTQFNLNAYTGFGKVARMLDMLNTEQYLQMRREAFANDGITTYPESAYDVNGVWDQSRYTDWQKIMIGNRSNITNIQAQISGGSTGTQFTFGVGSLKESTVFPGDYQTRNNSANLTLNHTSDNKKFELSLSARYLASNSNQPQMDFTVNDIGLPPNAPKIYDENGNLNWENETWSNPFAQLFSNASAKSRNLLSNLSVNYNIIDALQVKVNFGYNEQRMNQTIITPIKAFQPSLASISALRSHRLAESGRKGWIIEPQLNYNKKIADGELSVTFGGTMQENNNHSIAQYAYDFADDALIENIMAAADIYTEQNLQTQYRYIAFFARANYTWQNKYVLNIVGRRDGSTRFGPGKKYGNFGSIGAAWIFTNEELFKNNILTYGKIRGSYGVTGNDQLQDYQYLSTYSSYAVPYLGLTGLYPTRLYSPDYSWESVRKIETTLDLVFFADRIKLSTTFYRNRTGNQLVGYPLPTMTGFSSILRNLPAVVENKGWEFELNTTNIQRSEFTWSSSFNLSLPQNKLISYPNLENSSYRNRYEIGKPLSIQKLWRWTGVDPQTGIHTFQDVNGDDKISSPQDLQALINTAPQYFGGVNNTFSYKGISLDIFFQFVKKKGRLAFVGVPGSFINQPTWALERWRQPNDLTNVQRYSQSGTAFTTIIDALDNSDLAYGDASFVRLKNITLSYQLPKKVLRLFSLQQCRLFLQCQNLFTITNYQGLDPETVTSLPAIRMLTAGVNLTL